MISRFFIIDPQWVENPLYNTSPAGVSRRGECGNKSRRAKEKINSSGCSLQQVLIEVNQTSTFPHTAGAGPKEEMPQTRFAEEVA